MSESIYWAKLTDLQATIQVLPNREDSLMILERLPLTWLDKRTCQYGVRFEKFQPNESFNQWERGRIFNTEAEFRWEKVANIFQTVYVGAETTMLPAEFRREESLDLSNAICKTQSYFLWGERLTPEKLEIIKQPKHEQLYLELQIGRLLRYPVAKQGQRVQLHVMEYFEPQTQQRLYYRFQGVKTV